LCAGTYYRERLIDRWAAETAPRGTLHRNLLEGALCAETISFAAVIEAALNFSRGWNIPGVQSELAGAKLAADASAR